MCDLNHLGMVLSLIENFGNGVGTFQNEKYIYK